MIEFDKVAYKKFTQTWLDGINNEVFFWSNFIREKGGEWSADYERRASSQPKCHLERYVDCYWPMKVLDVGSGPISHVGIQTSRGNIELIACDALASIYDSILSDNNLTPYVRTEFALVERLTDIYEENYFDIVNMENALDHAFDPFIGIAEMLRVVKLGGLVTLCHAEDEAVRENYNGFHQWNISEEHGRLVIWRDALTYYIDEVFKGYADVTTTREKVGNIWLIRSELKKKKHMQKKREPLLNAYDSILMEYIIDSVRSVKRINNEFYMPVSEHEAVLNSISWRVTAPVRKVLDCLRQQFNRL